MNVSLSNKRDSMPAAQHRSPRVLVTGFGPFPGAPFNPTEQLVRTLARLPTAVRGNAAVTAHVFRTSYRTVDAELPGLLAEVRPDVVLLFGLAARTPFLRIEMLARNARTVLLPDVSGRVARSGGIASGGPRALRGRAPFMPLLMALRRQGLPVRLSRNAGRYLCNYAYWRLLEGETPLVLFVHVPKLARNARRRGQAVTADDLLRAGVSLLRAMTAAARRP